MTFEITPISTFPPTLEGAAPPKFIQFQWEGVNIGDQRVATVNFTGEIQATLSVDRGRLTLLAKNNQRAAPSAAALTLAGLQPAVVIPNHVILLLHGEGTDGGTTIFDSSPYNHNPPLTQLALTTSTTQFKYGAASLFFNSGSGSYVDYTPTSEWEFGAGDFTLAAWVYPTAVDATRRSIFDYRFDGSGSGTSWAVDFTTGLRFQVGVTTAGGTLFTVSAGSLTPNVWQFVAFVRDGNTLRSYVDGVQVGSTSGLGTAPVNPRVLTSTVRIGRRNDGGQNFSGWMDEVYINDTCLYPNGTTFTPPAGPFTP
ncbi:MAG: LamG domain-containing protein [Bacteroidetes bacterium]|nr:LamG domain-containing protein [Bacteroidota bacterium]